ncbi:MAG: SpoVR family protein, partial [Spirochaetota bacterium]
AYEEDYGLERVERLIDAGMAVQWNIDPDRDLHQESEQQARDRLYGYPKTAPGAGPYDDLLPSRERTEGEQKRRLRRKSPPEPTVDLLGYLISHSPRPLDDWERDVLSVIKEQAAYFMPYRRTKIMNEGWATYWHEKIMQLLFRRGFMNAEEHGFYNVYNARVKAHNPRTLNPYLLGYALFRSIEDRWDRGRFGREFEELESAGERETWDTGLGQGREKIMQVRSTYMDWFFVDEYLDREVVEELGLFFYLERDRETFYESVVEETDWRRVKRILVRSLMNWGVPRILVEDGNYRNSLQLYLRHQYEGLPLEEEYARRTLEHIYHLWDRPVHLETRTPVQGGASDQRRVYHADEDGVRVTTG